MRSSKKRSVKIANFEALQRVDTVHRSKDFVWLVFRLVLVSLLVMVMAGTELVYSKDISDVSVVFAVDTSSSMLSADLEPTRFDLAKTSLVSVIDKFEDENRPYKTGLVYFSGIAFVKNTLTDDMYAVRNNVDALNISVIQGTALGDAIITSTNLMVDEPEDRARVIILLTDGQNTAGTSTEDAVQFANSNFVSVYTLGVGTESGAPLYNFTQMTTKLNVNELQYIANSTNAKYYHITDSDQMVASLDAIFNPKDGLKSHRNIIPYLTLAIFIILMSEWLLINTKFKIVTM